MADNVIISSGTGTTIASDQVGTVHYQRIKVTDGTADSENHWSINSSGAGMVAINGNSTVVVGSGLGNIGFATVNVANNVTIGNSMVTVTLGTKLDSTNDSVDIKSGATVTVGSALPAGANYIGLVTAVGNFTANIANVSLNPSGAYIGLVTVANNLTVSNLNSAATVYAVVNTSGSGANVTLNPSPNYIGLVTVANNLTVSNLNSSATIYAVVNTSGAGSNVTLNPSPNYIGLVTVANNLTVSNLNSTATIYAVVNTSATNGITTDSGVTVYQGSTPWNSLGTATVGSALPAGTAFIGHATVRIAANNGTDIGDVDVASIAAGVNFIGHATVRIASNANTYIGLVTATVGNTINANVSLTSSVANIGFATVAVGTALPAGANYIGLATAVVGNTINANVSLSSSVANIGFATITPVPRALYTAIATVVSATGLATLIIPPADQKIFVKNIYASSLGRAELSTWAIASGASTVIPYSPSMMRTPWTALSTTAGLSEYFGEDGLQWGAKNESLAFALNGAATVGVRAVVRFAN